MVVDWATGVNTKIKRNGSSWEGTQKFITETTRSGKPKRRIANSYGKDKFSVTMRFSMSEYLTFKTWFNTVTIGGLYPFRFPEIDDSGHATIKEYRFADGGCPKYSNPSGTYVDCSMEWEEN